MSGVQTISVGEDESGMRLDRWFRAHFPTVRHGELEKFLRKGQVRVDGKRSKASRRLEEGEQIRVPPLNHASPAGKPNTAHRQEDVTFFRTHAIFEDDAVLAINKPFGIAVQGGTKTTRHIDGMLMALEKDGEKPRLVHRLDRDTGGLLLLAKTRRSAQSLSLAFQAHTIQKDYWALTAGVPRPREGTIKLAIDKRAGSRRDGGLEKVVPMNDEVGKPAITDYQTIDEAGHGIAFLAMRPITGRTHQLRVHAAAIECPIVGDGKYGGEAAHIEGVPGKLHLFCRAMTFPHPSTGKAMTLQAPLTGHMAETWKFFGFELNARYDWPEGLR